MNNDWLKRGLPDDLIDYAAPGELPRAVWPGTDVPIPRDLAMRRKVAKQRPHPLAAAIAQLSLPERIGR